MQEIGRLLLCLYRHGTQQFRRALDQVNVYIIYVQVGIIIFQHMLFQLRQCPGSFNAGRAAAYHHKIEQPRTLQRIRGNLCGFQVLQNQAPQV
ncbi:hypothetical protein D3C86_1635930 [compost metagenome]